MDVRVINVQDQDGFVNVVGLIIKIEHLAIIV